MPVFKREMPAADVFESAANSIPHMVWLADQHGAATYHNRRILDYAGLAKGTTLGLHWEDLLHPTDLPMVRAAWAHSVVTGEPFEFECRIRRHDGKYRWFLARAVSQCDDMGEVRGWVGTCTDIEDQKAAAIRFQAIIEKSFDAVDLIAADGTVLYASPPGVRLLGYPPEKDIGLNGFDLVHPDDQDRVRGSFERLLATPSGSANSTHRIRHNDGHYLWVELRATNLLHVPAVRAVVVNYRDVTDRIRVENALSESEHNLNAAQRIAHLGHWEQDLDTGRITASDETHRIFGLRPQEYLKTWEAWQEHIHPEDRPDRAAAIDRALHESGPYETKYRVVRPDGETRIIHCRGEVTPAGAGLPRRLFGTLFDVTEHEHAERALLDAERRLEHVVASSPAVLFTIRVVAGQFQDIGWMSRNIEAMLGYRVEEALAGNWWMSNIHPEDRDAVVTQFQAEIFSSNSFSAEYRFRHKDTRYHWIRGETRLLRDAAGQPAEVVGSLSDITGRKRLEDQFRQAQKLEAFGQLAAGVAHDFNNMLTIINGYSEMLLASIPPCDPNRESLAEIHKAGERSAELTRQLLAFSRQQVLEPRVLDLNEVVRDIASMLRRVIGEDVILSTAGAPALWPVKADPGQVEQLLLNLAVNARDAMPTGGKLTIETRNIELEGDIVSQLDMRTGPHVLLTVSDTGCGMPPAVLAKIFEPFFTTKGPGKGTGLGLATVYGIVRQSGGDIVVESAVGIGTTFKIYLPRLPRAEQAAGLTKTDALQALPPRGTETVLVLEDEAAVRALSRHILQQAGYTVLEAEGGDEALRVASGHLGAIDLLVTDVVMPGLGGRAVAERLIARRPGLRVLYVSGYTDDAVVRHGVLHDKANFLQKPFSPAALAWKVREVLDQRLS